MSKNAYPLRIPAGLLELAEIKGTYDRTGKSTALRQWLYAGAEVYVLDLLSSGRLTMSLAAEHLELSVHDLHRLAEEHGVEIGSTVEQYEQALGTVRGLASRAEENPR